MEKFVGKITHWNKERRFGFIEVTQTGGWLTRFFLIYSRIIRKEVEPDVDVPVVFTSTQQPHMPGGYPVAVDVQVLANGPSALQAEKAEPTAGV